MKVKIFFFSLLKIFFDKELNHILKVKTLAIIII